MTDDEMQRLAAIIADEVCRRGSEWIETVCFRTFVVVIAFWFARIAFVVWQACRKEMKND